MKTSPELSIVIPVLNEEGTIKVLVNSIEKALQFYSYEIIFVDDGSTDSTVVSIKSLKNSFINLIVFDSNKGQSSALAAGINLARGTYIITMDGDFQNDPSDIPKMVRMISNKNLDMVIGIRDNRQDPLIKTLPSKIANFLIRAMPSCDIFIM